MDTAPLASPPPARPAVTPVSTGIFAAFDRIPRRELIGAGIAILALIFGTVACIIAARAGSAGRHAAQLEARIAELEKRLDAISPPKSPAAAVAPTPSSATTVAPNPPGAAANPVATTPTTPAVPTSDAYDIVANDKLKGKTGRLIVAFPANTKTNGARIDVLAAGTTNNLRTNYGNTTLEFPAGTYDVVIGGRKITGVVIEARSDTRMRVGVVRLRGPITTRFDIYLGSGSDRLQNYYGDNEIGLPVGNYEIAVNGQRMKTTIQNGVVTDL